MARNSETLSFPAVHVVAMVLLVVWWLALGLALPVAEAANHFETMILNPCWVPVNLIGLVACVLLVLTLPVLYFDERHRRNTLGFAGLVVAEIGLVLFASIQYYETFLWPVVAQANPELVRFDGALVLGDPLVLVPLIASGGFLGVGYLLLGIALFRERMVPRYSAILLVVGAVLFGNGMAFPVRTIGLLIYAGATIVCCLALMRTAKTKAPAPG